MAKEQAHAFVQKLISDKAFSEQIAQHDIQQTEAFQYLKELGYDFDAAEFHEVINEIDLSDEVMEQVVGGTGDTNGGALAALLLAAGGAIAAAILSSFSSDNDFNFEGQ